MVQTNLIAKIGETHYGNRDLCRGMVRERRPTVKEILREGQ